MSNVTTKEVKLGGAKDTVIENDVEMNFKNEIYEVGVYLAIARQAQEGGYPEIATALRDVAFDEAFHAARFAEMNGKIPANLKENLERMLNGERMATVGKYETAKKAKEAGIDFAHDFFHEASREEGQHAAIIEGLLRRYFITKGEVSK